MRTSEVLRATRVLLKQGWTQGTAARTTEGASISVAQAANTGCVGGYCLTGALQRVAMGYRVPGSLQDNAMKALREVLAEDPVAFNDRPTTTLPAVLNAVERAERYAEQRGL